VIAGDRDSIVPVEQSRQLYDAASSPKRLVVIGGADHNDEALVGGPVVIQATIEIVAVAGVTFSDDRGRAAPSR
jgi:fermentation-respiration switch protein FrsA (DUF1100 family)